MNSKETWEKYNFSDFTEEHYINIIKLAKKKYSFESFTTKTKKPHVLWRHDVDSSIHRALKLAKIEKKLKVKSTYFLRLHSEWYNIFEKEVYEKINKIIKLGHFIGLHFEHKFYSKYKHEFKKYIKMEKNIIENTFPTKIDAISYYLPPINNLSKKDKLKFDKIFKKTGILNTRISKKNQDVIDLAYLASLKIKKKIK